MNIVFDTYQTLALAKFCIITRFFLLVKRIRVFTNIQYPRACCWRLYCGYCINGFI